MAIALRSLGTLLEDPTNSSSAVPYPATVVAGDVLVMWGSVSNASPTTVTLPAGWTLVSQRSAAGNTLAPNLFVALKVAAGTETGTLAVAHGSSATIWQMSGWSGVDNTTPQDAAATLFDAQASAIVLPSLTVATANAALIAIGTGTGTTNTATPPTGFTEMGDRTTGTRNGEASYQLGFAAGSSGTQTITFTFVASTRALGVLMALRPAVTSVPQGTGTGSTTYTGTAAGAMDPAGTGTGSTTYAGSAAGSTAMSGSGTGTTAYTGSAAGSTAMSGSGTGSTTYTGSAAGSAAMSGTGSGSTVWSGSATGVAPVVGSASGSGVGSTVWTGTATGAKDAAGTGSGATVRSGTAAGSAPASGSAAGGQTVWTGAAVGSSPAGGSGAGMTVWVGTAYAEPAAQGFSSGSTTWLGSADGQSEYQGAGAGLTEWVGTAFGSVPAQYGDRTVVVSDTLDNGYALAIERGYELEQVVVITTLAEAQDLALEGGQRFVVDDSHFFDGPEWPYIAEELRFDLLRARRQLEVIPYQ